MPSPWDDNPDIHVESVLLASQRPELVLGVGCVGLDVATALRAESFDQQPHRDLGHDVLFGTPAIRWEVASKA